MTPSLQTWAALAPWLEADLVASIASTRRARGEVQRERRLGTVQMLWLMLAVALRNDQGGLAPILGRALADLPEVGWTVSVSAFCQARARFSPRPVASVVRQAGAADARRQPA